jgi:hypothetical protein
VVFLVGSWLPVAALIWSRRALLRAPVGYVAALVAFAGALLLLVTVTLDLGPSWIIAVAMLVVAQVLALWRLYVGS